MGDMARLGRIGCGYRFEVRDVNRTVDVKLRSEFWQGIRLGL